MNHREIFNRRIRKAGRSLLEQKTSAGTEAIANELADIMKEAADLEIFLPWTEAAEKLELDRQWQFLLCALWGVEESGERMTAEAFGELYRTVFSEEMDGVSDFPAWLFVTDGHVMLSPVLTGWLSGRMPKLPAGVKLCLPSVEPAYGLEQLKKEVHNIFSAAKERFSPLILCIEGEEGSGREFAMEQICAEEGMALLLADGDVLKGTERELNSCMLCAVLYDAYFCISLKKEIRTELLAQSEECFSFFGIIKTRERSLNEHPKAAVLTRRLERPDRAQRIRIAQDMFQDLPAVCEDQQILNQLVGKQLPVGAYLRFLKNVREEILVGNSVKEELFLQQRSQNLHLLRADRTFEELKLPAKSYDQLRKISRMAASREEVLKKWGFDDKFSYGNGLSVLFYGAPGTGKTMAAQVLANELQMPLYRVDLSQVISKYIGETQKNIGRIFDEAEKYDCILLFDEADAIFAKRSDVSDAQDRYSNAETAYLLQRIEQYCGISILATNLLQNFDEAFRRRISYMVHFPMPDAGLRRQLWESIFPEKTPVSAEVDFMMLAQAFEMSGASIKNAALHGALMAHSEGEEVCMKHLLDGIQSEYGKQGKVFNSSQKELLDAFQ